MRSLIAEGALFNLWNTKGVIYSSKSVYSYNFIIKGAIHMKKILSLIISLMLIMSLVSCGTNEVAVDYANVSDFETALNNGENVTNKTVTISVEKLVPNSAFGYNIQTGEHLNFCSSDNPNVEIGDVVTVKVTEVSSMLGSYIISYEMIDKASSNDTQNNQKKSELLPVEVKEFGYSMNGEYLYYSIKLYNPNNEKAIELPQFRVTARNDAGEILATEEQTLSVIYPEQEFVYASQAFDVDEAPAKVDVEVLEPNDYNIKNVSVLDHPNYVPLKAVNTAMRADRLVGEIQNDNDYDLDSAIVTVIFRDENGKLIGGESTFVDSVKANSTTPFDMFLYQDFITTNYEVYANIW